MAPRPGGVIEVACSQVCVEGGVKNRTAREESSQCKLYLDGWFGHKVFECLARAVVADIWPEVSPGTGGPEECFDGYVNY